MIRERTAAQVLVDQLVRVGVDTAYCVPGESYLSVLDALWQRRTDIVAVTCRQEGGAAMMANAHARAAGTVGVCLVTRGPGATNASIGVHTSAQDGVPLLLIVGQVQTGHEGRYSFQEVDYDRFFGGIAKAVVTVRSADRIAEATARAVRTACAGRPGPVVLVVPQDVGPALTSQGATDLVLAAPAAADPQAVEAAAALLSSSQRPMIVVGGPVWSHAAHRLVARFAETHGIAVTTAYRRQDYVDNCSPAYVGVLGSRVTPELAQAVVETDVVLALGTRLGQVTSGGWALVRPPVPTQRIVSVMVDEHDIGRIHQPTVAAVCRPEPFLEALLAAPIETGPWKERTSRLHDAYLADLGASVAQPDEVDLTAVMAVVRDQLHPDAVVTNGAGNFTYWCNGMHQFRRYGTQLGTTTGAMGYAIPAAIAAKLARPDRPVVAFTGDGDFLMNAQELATAVQYGCAGFVVIVVNNGVYGTIRAHQETRYPGHVLATELVNPDFVGFARSFGLDASRVERTADFSGALAGALTACRPALIELVVPGDIVSPDERLEHLADRAGQVGSAAR